MAISGRVGAVYVSDVGTAPVNFTDQATTDSGDHKRYQVTNAAYRYWPLDAAITVKKNGGVVSTGFTLERAGGYVVFDVANQPSDTITVSGQALTLVQCGGMFSWSADMKADLQDVTTFASGGWKENLVTLDGWSGSAEAYWGNRQFFDSLGEILVVKLFVDSGASQRCLEGHAIITSEGIEAAVDDIVKEKIEFEGVGPLYARL